MKAPRLDGWNSWNGDGWVEAWVALLGRIHGMVLVFVSKRGSSSTIRPSSCSQKGFTTRFSVFHDELGNSKSLRATT